MPTIASRLDKLGLTLPDAPAALANYLPAVAVHGGTTVFVSGQLPIHDGTLIASGQVPDPVAMDTAVACARQCAVNALAAVHGLLGSLERVRGVARVGGFVAAPAGFADHPRVINGASDVLVELFGDSGRHARAAVGVTSLPMDAPVEIEFTFLID